MRSARVATAGRGVPRRLSPDYIPVLVVREGAVLDMTLASSSRRVCSVSGWATGVGGAAEMGFSRGAAGAGAALTKGLIGCSFGVAFVVYLAWKRELRLLIDSRLIVVALLPMAAMQAGRDFRDATRGACFVREFLIENMSPFYGGRPWRHSAPFWYYTSKP